MIAFLVVSIVKRYSPSISSLSSIKGICILDLVNGVKRTESANSPEAIVSPFCLLVRRAHCLSCLK